MLIDDKVESPPILQETYGAALKKFAVPVDKLEELLDASKKVA
jgi:hypothetical protein